MSDPFEKKQVMIGCPDNRPGCLVLHYDEYIPAKKIIKEFIESLEHAEKEQRKKCQLLIESDSDSYRK